MSPGGASGPFVVVFGIRLQTTKRPHEAQWQRVTEEKSRCVHVHVPRFCTTVGLQMSCFSKEKQMETIQQKCHERSPSSHRCYWDQREEKRIGLLVLTEKHIFGSLNGTNSFFPRASQTTTTPSWLQPAPLTQPILLSIDSQIFSNSVCLVLFRVTLKLVMIPFI